MNIFVSTLFPQLYTNFLATSIIKRAISENKISVSLQDMFSFVLPKERIDSEIVGHGSGMLLGAPIVEKVYNKVEQETNKKPFVIFFSPHGKILTQDILKKLFVDIADRPVLLFSGRYEGFDARAEDHYADAIISIGDYVLFGGDLPIMIFLEGILRLIPGVVGKQESVDGDSFSNAFLDHPHYAAPDVWQNRKVPPVLKSGDHKKIAAWRLKESVQRTVNTNWKWLSQHHLNKEQRDLVKETIPNHYCVLLHNDVMLPGNLVGNSSVTSMDIHDIARSSTTYGIKKYFIVTRLDSQKKLVEKFLQFWQSNDKAKVNPSRAFALKHVMLRSELSEVIDEITATEGVVPITIVTSSRRNVDHPNMISYQDQVNIWKQKRPVVFIFGTSHGIDNALIEKIDYKLLPLEGLEEFNFLSVRSAAAIVFDRWLGFNTIKK
jgi:tRNA (guanine37-N1)-methyltransferase